MSALPGKNIKPQRSTNRDLEVFFQNPTWVQFFALLRETMMPREIRDWCAILIRRHMMRMLVLNRQEETISPSRTGFCLRIGGFLHRCVYIKEVCDERG